MTVLPHLTHLGLLRISGPDAKKFLQGQLTCNLEEITPEQSRLGAHCNPQGRVISLFRIFIFQQDYFLSLPLELISLAKKALEKYAVFFKVTLSDASEMFQQFGGNFSLELPTQVDQQITTGSFILIKVAEKRFLLLGTCDQSADLLNSDEWKRQNILDQIPTIYPATSEKFLPHELNLPDLNAVSFTKGCYTGQEIIARMQYRGKIKKHLKHVKIKTEATLQLGDDIHLNPQSTGEIVDLCQIAYNDYEVLAVINVTK